MNITEKSVEILNQIQSGVQKAGTFAWEQIGDIAFQAVLYGRLLLTLKVVGGFMLMLAAIIWVWKFYSNYKQACVSHVAKHRYDSEPNCEAYIMAGGVGGMLLGFSGVGLVVANFSDMLLVWAAPKLWLIMHIARLVKQVS